MSEVTDEGAIDGEAIRGEVVGSEDEKHNLRQPQGGGGGGMKRMKEDDMVGQDEKDE